MLQFWTSINNARKLATTSFFFSLLFVPIKVDFLIEKNINGR